jgi:hypothetical protein
MNVLATKKELDPINRGLLTWVRGRGRSETKKL